MALKRNKPSPEGYMLGEHMAKWCEQEIAQYANTGLAVPQRCDTCAFRAGTYANGCVPTVMDALKCIMEGKTQFMCHEHRKDQALPVCAGYMLLAATEKEGVKAPWKFCDEYTEADKIEEAA